jgi:hypothetical protein
MSALVSTLRERTLQELTSAGGNLRAELAQTAQAVIPLVSRRFPHVISKPTCQMICTYSWPAVLRSWNECFSTCWSTLAKATE